MAYTNSPLAIYKPLNKNHYESRKSILGIVPHCVVGHGSAQGVWDWFKGGNNASCNYYIDDNGGIYCFVDEKYGSWCTSSYEVDMTHVTVEIASDAVHPYKITDKAYEALIKLTADVYKRNGIKKCIWAEDKRYDTVPGGVPMHRNYKIKACPGDYIVSKYRSGDFCKRVNAILEGANASPQKDSKPVNDIGTVKYSAHVQGYGWLKEVHNGMVAGTEGESRRLEAFKLDLGGITCDIKTHVQGVGWKTIKDVTKDTVIGTTGKAKRLEAFEVCNVQGVPEGKKLHYSAHVQGVGWISATQGYPVGSMAQGKRIEAVKFWIE